MRAVGMMSLCLLGLCWAATALFAGEMDGLREGEEKAGAAADDELAGPSDRQLQELAQLAQVGNVRSRGEAIWLLARLDDARASEPIARLIAKAEPELRPHIAMGLGWLGRKARDTAPALARFLDDPSEFTQSTAIWALGRMGGPQARKAVEPFLGSKNELVRFLAEEAIARLDGKELLPKAPLIRPLKGATLLAVSEGDAGSFVRLFRGPLIESGVRFEAVVVGPFNPSMGYLGGMAPAQQQRFSELLAFEDGRPRVDLVLLTPIYEHELPPKLRWELWNYVRRGGKLVTTDLPFRRFELVGQTTSQQKIRLKYEWAQSLFDTLLPEKIGPAELPYLDGVAQESRGFRYGVKETGRGAVVVMGQPGSAAVRIADLFRTANVTWRNMAFWSFLGTDRAKDPLLWFQVLQWLLEGPGAFPASVALAGVPTLGAGEKVDLSLRVRNYSIDDPALRLAATLVSPSGTVVAAESKDLRLEKGGQQESILPLGVPVEACEEDYLLRTTLTGAGGRKLREAQTRVKVVPCVSIALAGPGEFHGPGERLSVKVRLEKRSGLRRGGSRTAPTPASLYCSLADHHLRPLLRQEAGADFAEAAKEFRFEFLLPELPAGGYHWLAEVRRDGRLLGRKTALVARMEPWRFRKELVVAPFGFGALQPKDEIEALRSIGMTTYGLPPSFGMWTYLIESPSFIPRLGWPADILNGPEGDEWRKLGEKHRSHPFLTFLDTVEESDLQIGSNLVPYGDVEEAGHEQYRTYLKRKYRTLSALNAAWKSDYTDWTEVVLLGAVRTVGDDVSFTSRAGGTSGELVPVPKELDPKQGITSFQPYHDQNAWRWYYVWLLLEIRHAAFHQADPYHAVTPGGAMGLHAPFDAPHFRIYAGDPLTSFSRRATFGRPTYGTKPHIVLIGVASEEKAVSRTCWQALAAGGRSLMPYGAGDAYGVRLLNSDYTPTEMGRAFGRVMARIKSKQEVLLATQNAVDHEALLLSEGDDGYSSAFSLEVYDAILSSGVLPDYGTGLSGRKLVATGASELSLATAKALRKFAEEGGVLLLLPRTSGLLLRELGLERGEEKLRKAKLGKGAVFLLNSDFRYGDDLESRYTPGGKVRIEAEAHRKAIAAALAEAGVAGAFETLDEDGSVIPYVEVEPLATEDGSQRYLIAYADHRIPKGMASARGRIQVKLPRVRSVYDVYAERSLALRDGQFPFELEPGGGTVFSLLTEEPATVEVAPEVKEFGPGAPLRICVRVNRADGKLSECEHAFNVHIFDSTGKEIEALHQRASIKGRGVVTLFPSWSDPDGEWRIVAHDLTAGLKGEGRVRRGGPAWPPSLGAHKGAPLQPTEGFKEPVADLKLAVRPLPELNALANFVRITATVSRGGPAWPPSLGAHKGAPLHQKPVAARVRLRIPKECLLSGEAEQAIQLTPESPSKEIAWTVFISRETAVGFYYSDKTSGFFTDGLYPGINRYRGTPTPAIEVETAAGERLTFQAGDGPISASASRFAYRVPVRLNPFEWAPASLGTFDAGKVAVSVLNETGSTLAGKVLLKPHEHWAPVPGEIELSAESGKTSTLTVAPKLRSDARIEQGLFEMPVRIQLGGRELDAGKLTVEHKVQRRWLVRRGARLDAEKEELPFNPAGPFPERAGWQPIVTEARMPLSEALPEVGSVAYAATYIESPETRPVRVKLSCIGARTWAWLNGVLVTGEAKAPTQEAGHATDEILAELGSQLQKGRNALVIRVSRTHHRCRGCTVTLLDRDGKVMRDVRLEPEDRQ